MGSGHRPLRAQIRVGSGPVPLPRFGGRGRLLNPLGGFLLLQHLSLSENRPARRPAVSTPGEGTPPPTRGAFQTQTRRSKAAFLFFSPAGGSPGPQLHAGLRTHLGERAAGRAGTPGPRRGGAGSGSVGFGRARRAESGLRGQLAGGAAGPESARVGKGRGPRGSKGRGSSPPTAAIGRRWARPAPRGSRT